MRTPLELDHVRAGATNQLSRPFHALLVAGFVGAEGKIDNHQGVAGTAHDRRTEVDHIGGLVTEDHVRG